PQGATAARKSPRPAGRQHRRRGRGACVLLGARRRSGGPGSGDRYQPGAVPCRRLRRARWAGDWEAARGKAMNLELSKEERELQSRAREFAEKYLFPHEVECDENEGIPKQSLAKINKAVIDFRLNGFTHTKEDGGQGFTHFQQILIHEELGKATNGL